MATKSLDIIIKAHDRASKEFRQLRREIDALNQAGSNMQDLGAGFLAFGAAMASGLGFAVTAAAELEQAVARVASVMDRSAGDWADITNVVREFGRTTTHSAVESAQGLQLIAQYGYKLADAQKILATSLKLSTAQQYDLAMTTDILISTFKNFEKQGISVAKVADVLSKASNISSASMDKFRYSLKYVSPVANALGISLEEMVAQLSLLYDAGLPAETAGTALRMAYSRLLEPTKKATDALAKYGITLDQVNPQTRNFADIIDTLNKAGVSTNDIFTIFGVETAPAMLAMMARGGDALRKYEQQLKNAGGSMEKMYKVQMSTLNSQLKILKNNFTDLAISLGMALLPAIKKLVPYVQKLATTLNGMSDGNKQLIAFGMLAATGFSILAGAVLYFGGALLIGIAAVKEFWALLKGAAKVASNWKWVQTVSGWLSKLRTAFTGTGGAVTRFLSILGRIPGIGWIFLAVLAVITFFTAAWKNNWLGIREAVTAAWNWITTKVSAIAKSISEFASSVGDWFSNLDIMGSLQSAWSGIVEWVTTTFQSIKNTIYNFLMGILMDTGQTQQQAAQTLRDAWTNIVNFFTGIGNALKFIFWDMWFNMFTTVSTAISLIYLIVTTKWNEMTAWLSAKFTAIKTMVNELWSSMVTSVTTYLAPIMPYIQTIWNFITAIFRNAWTLIKGIVQAGIAIVSALITGGLNALSAIFSAIWNTIVNVLRIAWNTIKSVAQSGINIVKNVIALGVNLIAFNWRAAWNNVKNIVKSAWDIIKTTIKGGIDSAKAIITGAAGAFKTAGSALMDALASGIKSAIGKVTGAIESVMSAARRFLGNSDAKEGPFSNVTHSGYATMSAFAKGATQAKSLLSRKIGGTLASSLAGGTAGSFGIKQISPVALSPTPSEGQQVFNINLTINGVDNPETLARSVLDIVQRELRR